MLCNKCELEELKERVWWVWGLFDMRYRDDYECVRIIELGDVELEGYIVWRC